MAKEKPLKKEIRILILDDVPGDVVQMNHELRRGGLSFCTKRVETREAFLSELQHNPPDIVLSDHGLPSFDGFTALAIAKDKCPTVPFIFVSGDQGGCVAIESFEGGATDYVLKNRLVKLVPAIRRALRLTEDRARRAEAERELRESEERFRLLVESVKDYAIVMLDVNGLVTSWNSGAQWLHGFRPEEVIGQHFSMFYRPEEVKRGLPEMSLRTAAAENRFEEEGLRIRKGGKTFLAHVVINASRNSSGQIQGYSHVTRDITAPNQAEEALRKSETLKRAILDTALDAIISIDHAGLIQEWNPAAQRMFGYSRAKAMGQPIDRLIIPASLLEIYRDGLANYLMTGAGSLVGKPIELSLRRSDGSEFRAELAISRVLTEDPPRCTALVRDITERKQAEEALRRSEERLRMLVDGIKTYAIYLLDTEGCVATWNSGAERVMGYPGADIIGKHVSSFFTPEDVRAGLAERQLQQAAREGQSQNEGWRLRQDGSRIWVEGVVTALRDRAGKLYGYSELAHDITTQKQAEESIKRLNATLEERVQERTAELEAANQELEAFSYSVSHDLRAPLLHINGYAQILLTEAADNLREENRAHLRTIAEEATQLGNLIDALLEFSRMGRAEMRRQTVKVAGLVEEARRALRQETRDRDIEWKIGRLPEVKGDAMMLKQALINLLSNALKYSRTRTKTEIEIGATPGELEDTFFVRDNGVGFDQRYAAKLFGVFQRLHPASEVEGTGIGLANVRRIVHRHGGRVWAEGVPDKGATFYFTLPRVAKGTSS